ncbi:arrestin domain-containing protein 3-like [Engraulis encrasicolus]|uniref:arrestin domain-containing protein 3-like n=1 Tax=Engraulis encrasicolus TaxID=184585 RepID=UPI002FCEF416
MGIESISVDYDAINEKNTFSNGDHISGRVTVHVSSPTKIQSLAIKAKGKAKVRWSEHYGNNTTVTYSDKEKYFSEEKLLLEEGPAGSLELAAGRHVYPFSFQIPDIDMPPSFKGSHGKIRYNLKAILSRSLHVDKKAKTSFTFIAKAYRPDPGLMVPQYGSKDKDVGLSFFASGNISMNISTEKMAYHQGEDVQVKAEIINSSTRKIVPKFYIYQKQSFFAMKRRRVVTKDILKEKGLNPMQSSTSEIMTQNMTIPKELLPSVLNCRIIKVEYRIKAVLHVSMSRDPEIKLPLIILLQEHTKEAELPAYDWSTQKMESPPPAYGWSTQTNGDAMSAYNWPNQNEAAPPAYDWSTNKK